MMQRDDGRDDVEGDGADESELDGVAESELEGLAADQVARIALRVAQGASATARGAAAAAGEASGRAVAVATELESLADLLTEGQSARGVWLPDLDPAAAVVFVAELAAWVDQLAAREGDLALELELGCWARHPAVVDRLIALRSAWWGVYRLAPARVQPTAGVEFYDRWLAGLLPALHGLLADCSPNECVAGRQAPFRGRRKAV